MKHLRYFCLAIVLGQAKSLSAQSSLMFKDADVNTNLISTNPAFIQLAREQWAAAIFSFEGNVSSNTGSMATKDLLHINTNFLRQHVLGTSGISTGTSNLNFKGPSIAYGVTSKLNLMATTRTRFHSNYWRADGRLISEIGEVVKVPQEYPYHMNREQMKMVAAVFSEIGLSASYVGYETERSVLTIGASLILVNAVSGTSISVPELTGTVKRINSYLTSLSDATGQVSTQTAGEFFGNANIRSLFRRQQLSLSSTAGFVYTHRRGKGMPYRFKLGLSVNDIGRLRFHADSAYSKSYNISIPANKGLYFNNNFNNSTFSQTTRVFDKYPEFFDRTTVSSGKYSIGLPTTLHLATDVFLISKLFVGVNGQLSLRAKNQITSLRSNSGLSVSPRWNEKGWAFSASVGYHEFGALSSGLSFNVGPVFFSGSTLLSSTLSRSRQLNVEVGIILPPSLFK